MNSDCADLSIKTRWFHSYETWFEKSKQKSWNTDEPSSSKLRDSQDFCIDSNHRSRSQQEFTLENLFRGKSASRNWACRINKHAVQEKQPFFHLADHSYKQWLVVIQAAEANYSVFLLLTSFAPSLACIVCDDFCCILSAHVQGKINIDQVFQGAWETNFLIPRKHKSYGCQLFLHSYVSILAIWQVNAQYPNLQW